MRKVLTIALREYKEAVKTKGFIISLIMMPVLMGGSTAISLLTQNKVDTSDKKIVVIDHSGLFFDALQQSVTRRNEYEIFTAGTHEKIKPAFYLKFVEPDIENLIRQKLELSDRVMTKELYGYLEIGPSVLHPDRDPDNAFIKFFSENSVLDETVNWFSNPINNHLRQLRLAELNLPADSTKELFYWANIENLGLLKLDESTGNIMDAEKTNAIRSILIPYLMAMLIFMMVMMASMPLITAVMEEKLERISEVLLAVVTPFQFMAGKIIGNTCVSLTTAMIYVAGGVLTLQLLGGSDFIPYELIPWFFLYLIFFLIMSGSVMTALGSACNDNKDTQNISFPAMIPILLPLFVIMPVLRNPTGAFATWFSLIPPFTPILMMVRQSTPVTIPVWQPYAGLAGVIIFTFLCVWIGARIFRTGILMQGQKPTLANLIKYAFSR
jgi:ABC-2 type transport system permease protein